MSNLTPARLRVLRKAHLQGFVCINGGFSGDPMDADEAIEHEMFDRKGLIEELVRAGLLTYGRNFNQYELTDVGRTAFEEAEAAEAARPVRRSGTAVPA